jgi:putative inorganic carbon (HCO3(-)) transporter
LYSTFRSVTHVSRLVLAWTLVGAVSALVGLSQSFVRWREAIVLKAPLYDYVLDGRITGFQSHWMTFGGVQMVTLLMLLAYLALGSPGRWKFFGWTCVGLIWSALVLGFTRSIFLAGVPAGGAVLLWVSRRWTLLVAPALTILLLLLPFAAPVRERVLSVLQPHGEIDSNSRRVLMIRTGVRMIQTHPFLGVGPEQIEPQFEFYLPADAPKPIPDGWYGHLHNIYLQYAAERGIPALLCVLWMFARVARDLWRATRATTNAAWVSHGVLAVIAAVLTEGLFEHNLGDSEVLTVFLVAVTCGYVVLRSESARSSGVRLGACVPCG